MNDDQLNDNLKSRISEVFDHYEDDTADESWLLLREKFPAEQDKDRAVVWLWRNVAAVALILTILNIGLWLNFHQSEKTVVIVKNVKSKYDNKQLTDQNKTSKDQKYNDQAEKTITAASTLPNTVVNQHLMMGNNPNDNKPTTTTQSVPSGSQETTANNPNSLITNILINKAKLLDVVDSALIPHTTTEVKKQDVTENIATNKAQVSTSMQSLFDKEKTQPKLSKAATNITSNANTVALSIYEATFINYSKGSNKQLNTGAGLTSDIRISPNFSLSTGISIAQNTLSYNTSSPNEAIPLAMAASRNFSLNTSMLYDVVPTSQTLNASLVGLDVPVNLKYIFDPQSRNTYISAGFSSGTFINETYNYNYNYTSPNNSGNQGSQDEVNRKSFDSFYLAQMLNLSFGVGYPIGKNNLIIEPFVKYPLNGLGDQHLLFGSGGLNLKFNFGTGKATK